MLKITLPSGAFHLIEGIEKLEDYSSSENTRAALQAAYDAGNWEPYTPPEPEPEPQEPNWQDFRLSLMVSTSFRDWAADLPADWREDLKACAILCNAEALQTTYTMLARIYTPEPAAAREWQQIAIDAHIPVVFEWPPA
jgi:hypothetical protein